MSLINSAKYLDKALLKQVVWLSAYLLIHRTLGKKNIVKVILGVELKYLKDNNNSIYDDRIKTIHIYLGVELEYF